MAGGTNQFVSSTGGAINWPVEDGALVSTPNSRRSNNLVSRLHFRDARLHVEFMLPPQGDGNSGIYLQGLYELQILNSAGKKHPGLGDMGAVYGLYKPLVDAALPPGQWQAYDVLYIAPRRDSAGKLREEGSITAWLNGRLIHDHVRIGDKTSDYNPYRYDTTEYLATIAKRQQTTMVGPLILQDHDCPVRFRNIWVKPCDDQAAITIRCQTRKMKTRRDTMGNERAGAAAAASRRRLACRACFHVSMGVEQGLSEPPSGGLFFSRFVCGWGGVR